jgi:hypothetical protein
VMTLRAATVQATGWLWQPVSSNALAAARSSASRESSGRPLVISRTVNRRDEAGNSSASSALDRVLDASGASGRDARHFVVCLRPTR